jgi:hypothetical protein
MKPVARLPGRVSNPEGRIVLDQLRLGGPTEQSAHGIKKVAGLRWRARTSLSASHDDLGRDLGERLVACRLDHMEEDVFALPPSRPRQGRPCRGLAIAGNEPPKGAQSLAFDLLWACRASDSCLILSAKLWGAKVSPDADARPFANAHIPNGLAVPGDLPMQMWRAWAGHTSDHRTISSDCSRAGSSVLVDGEMRMMIVL